MEKVPLGFFSGFTAIVLFFSLIAIWRKKCWTGRLRILGCIPQIFHGLMAVHTFKTLRGRFGDNVEFAPHSKDLVISTAIKAVVGLTAIGWSVFLAVLVRRQLKKSSKPSRIFFYLFSLDLAFIACFATSIAYGRTSLPTNLTDCDDLSRESTRLFSRVGYALGEDYSASCRRVLATQMMTIILMPAMLLQSYLLIRHTSFPTGIRVVFFFAVRLVRSLLCLDDRRIRIRDVEKGDTAEAEKRTLSGLFRHAAVAANIASHLHYSEVVNVSLSSKELRRMVLFGSEKTRDSERLDLLTGNSCQGEKSECWACARIICSTCKINKHVQSTRTRHHMTNCQAICTRCYFLRAPAESAPLSATLRPGNLSFHHCKDSGVEIATQAADLCPHCSTLESQQITAMREERERVALQVSLRRRIHCATCEKALPRGSMRWWICSTGNHECHWKGHDAKRR